MRDYIKYLNKTVFIRTIYGKVFTIKVEKIDDIELSGLDKFNEPCDITLTDISSITVQGVKSYGY